MSTADILVEFHRRYLSAEEDERRLDAIRQLRCHLRDRLQAMSPAQLAPVLEGLLHYTDRDGPRVRIAAAELLEDVWRGLHPATRDSLFHDFTRRMLECCPAPGAGERAVVWNAIRNGFETAAAPAVERLCRELAAEEVHRCLDRAPRSGLWSRLVRPPAPNLDILRLIATYAPASAWPRLTRDLWQLYNLDTEPILGLTFPELLALRRTDAGARHRLANAAAHQTNPSAAWLRRSFNGVRERWTPCWDLGRRMLHRTLAQARPADLGDAAPRFFAWLESLVALPEEELEPLLRPLVGWATPAVLRVLERWEAGPTAWERFVGVPRCGLFFRLKAARAAAELRAALAARGAELVPAGSPIEGRGNEAAPAIPAPVVPEGR